MRYIYLSKANGVQFKAKVDDQFYDALTLCPCCERDFHWQANTSTYTTYASRRVSGKNSKRVLMHRSVMEMYLGRPLSREEEVDHIDGNGINNQISNLRLCSRSENSWNCVHRRTKSVSGYLNVQRVKNTRNRWFAVVTVNGTQIISHKSFSDPGEAAVEADLIAAFTRGEFARFNFEDRRDEYFEIIKAGWKPAPPRIKSSRHKHISYKKDHPTAPWLLRLPKQGVYEYHKTETGALESRKRWQEQFLGDNG